MIMMSRSPAPLPSCGAGGSWPQCTLQWHAPTHLLAGGSHLLLGALLVVHFHREVVPAVAEELRPEVAPGDQVPADAALRPKPHRDGLHRAEPVAEALRQVGQLALGVPELVDLSRAQRDYLQAAGEKLHGLLEERPARPIRLVAARLLGVARDLDDQAVVQGAFNHEVLALEEAVDVAVQLLGSRANGESAQLLALLLLTGRR